MEERQPTRILIVEDEAITAMSINKMLQKHGYEVVGMAASGEEAIALAAASRPHLVLMDILLDSSMDGIEAARRITTQQRIPVIYITAHSDEATLTRAMATEPHGYMLKPINQHDLFSSIELALYKHTMEVRLRESEEKYRLLAENSLDVIWTMTLDGTFTYVSPSVTTLAGFTPEEVLKMPLHDYIGPYYDEVATIIAEELKKPPHERAQSRQMELQQVSKSGVPIDIEVKVSWLHDETGTPVGLQGITRDISARKHAERAVQESEEKYRTLFNSMSDAVAILDPATGKIIEANQTLVKLFGITAGDGGPTTLADFMTGTEPYTVNTANEVVRGVMAGGPGVVEWYVRKKDGTPFWVETSLKPITIGGQKRILANIRDMSRQKTTEETLQQFNRDLQYSISRAEEHNQVLEEVQNELTEIQTFLIAAIEQSPEGILIVNAHDLTVRYLNSAALAISGIDTLPPPHLQWKEVLGFTLLDERTRRPYPDDESPILLINALPVTGHDGVIIAGILFFTDITTPRYTKRDIDEYDERFALAVEAANDGIFDWNLRTGTLYRSPRWFTMLGYDPGDLAEGFESWEELIHPEDRGRALDLLQRHGLDQRTEFEVEYRMLNRDRRWRWILARGRVVSRNEAGVPLRLVGTHMDITDRKSEAERTSEGLRRIRRQQHAIVTLATCGALSAGRVDDAFRIITETAARALRVSRVSIWLMDDDGERFTCVDLYEAAARSHSGGISYGRAQFPRYFEALTSGRAIDASDAFADPRTAETAADYLMPFDVRSLVDAPVRVAGALAGIISFEQTGRLRTWEPDEVSFAGEIADQIAQVLVNRDRGLVEEQLRASLNEKEMLLKEIHHRVKNNLQIISSLLSLQAMQLKDEGMRQLFRMSQDRVRSMALIHEKLYRSHNYTAVNFEDYTRDLVNELRTSYADRVGTIAIEIAIPGLQLPIDRAIPCGLIITELVTNAIKYAFPDGAAGTVTISLATLADGCFELVIADTGVGLPAGIVIERAGTLGLQLVSTLVKQLKGTLHVGHERGTRFTIRFNHSA